MLSHELTQNIYKDLDAACNKLLSINQGSVDDEYILHDPKHQRNSIQNVLTNLAETDMTKEQFGFMTLKLEYGSRMIIDFERVWMSMSCDI